MTTTKINILHDGSFDIATGKSRREMNWKNREMLWSELVEKLSVTHRTAETYQEYLASKKIRQDEIKDIGGFVGGYLNKGRRLKGSIVHRQLITLDIDFAKEDIWDNFTMLYDCAAVLYSTHKHHAESPRYRLIIPLDRQVMADEYMALSRKIAGILGIENFDHTTFQPTRLMYWPSTSKDGEYVFEFQDGPWLNADEILATYHNWMDSSEWPVSDREGTIIDKAMKKQGDPLEKRGIVGAWCRTYTIHEVIELFLQDVYEPCDIEGRYTFKEGSTAAGLITYDDKFAYSHHGTDPVSGKLCNAFDLVRIHKYGLKDEDAREGTPGNKLPSYIAMEQFCTRDDKVKKQIGHEKTNDAKDDFSIETAEIIESDDGEWRSKLDVDRKGNYYPTIDNIVIILENDPVFKNSIAFDEFEQRPVFKRNLPWRKVTEGTRFLTDRDDHNIEHYLEKVYQISATKLEKALSVVYEKHLYHPVRTYLEKLDWDGEERVDSILIDYMGAEDNEYIRGVIRKTLVAAVARVFEPGVKFDHVLTLVGEEGKRKSSLLKKLGRQWFTDTFNLHMLQGKEGYEQIRGVWFIEISELSGMARAEVERVKGFISAQEDRYRQAYGRKVENFPRQCVFFGTTNKTDFLKGQTGNRRFWPVKINADAATKDVFRDLTDDEVDQVWAEAVLLYQKGEPLYLTGDLEQLARYIQKNHTEEHPWTGIVRDFLEKKLPKTWNKMNRYERIEFLYGEDALEAKGEIVRTRVCVAEIWDEALRRKDPIDERNTIAIRGIMRSFDDWQESDGLLRFGIYGPQRRGYIRNGFDEFEAEKSVTNAVTEV
jgi:putative DNA primase/helicase